ncbi:superfamily I DNA/RNA helicase [Oxalobacteraceae bacterium GrIS 1.18]
MHVDHKPRLQRQASRDASQYKVYSYQHMATVAEEADDRELLFLTKVVEKYGNRIPRLIQDIRARHVDVDKQNLASFSGIFFMTGHKSKGLQFKQVLLTDDYTKLVDDAGHLVPLEKIDKQEINVLYVALTRAEETLSINLGLRNFLESMRKMQYTTQKVAA